MKNICFTRFIVVFYCASITIGCRTTKQRPIVDNKDGANDREKRGMDLQEFPTTDISTSCNTEAEQAVTSTKSNNNTTSLLHEAELNKNKTSEGDKNPLASSGEEETDEIKYRKTREKSYNCYCEEAAYSSDCLKKCQSAKQFSKDDYDHDVSIEMAEDPLESYTNKVPRTTTESIKFSSPYAKNMNVDKRIILGNNLPESYTAFSNPQMKIPKNYLLPLYSQTPNMQYALGMKENYLASALEKSVAKGTFIPSIIGRKFANIQECMKLYGQTVCVIAPTTKTPGANSELIATDEFMSGSALGNKINEIDEACADNKQNQNTKSTTGYPDKLAYQFNTISPPYEIKYPSIHDPKLMSNVKIDKLYSVGSNYYIANKQQPYANHFNYDKKMYLNNGQNKNLQKSFNGKYYLNKNNINIAQATSHNNNDKGNKFYYLQTVVGVPTPRPVAQEPVYATKYSFPTTPSYIYFDDYDNAKAIVKSKESNSDAEIKKNYEQMTDYDLAVPNIQNYNFEGARETTRYPVQYLTTIPNSRYDSVKNSKFFTTQATSLHNEYKNNEAHRLLDRMESIVDNTYTGSQDKEITNYPILLEQTTILPFLQPSGTYVTDQQKNSDKKKSEENKKMKGNSYNLAKARNKFAQGLSSNKEKNRKLFFSNEYNYNSDTKVTSSARDSHTLSYMSNSIPENQLIEDTTHGGINVEERLETNSNDCDSSNILSSIRKEYEGSDNLKPMSFSHDPQFNQADNVNYYKSDSAQSKNNELYYSSNDALEYDKYKDYKSPQPQFDYPKFPQSMSRIINEANGQYINDYIAKTAMPKTYLSDRTLYVDQSMPIHTTVSMSHTTPPSLLYNNKAETTINQENYYPATFSYDVRNGRPPNNIEYQDRYINTRLPLESFNLKKQNMILNPEQFVNAQNSNIKLNSKINNDLQENSVKSITTLEDLGCDEYKKYYKLIKTSTAKSTDDFKIDDAILQSQRKYPNKLSKQKIRLKMYNDSESLFRGLEQIILNNYDPDLSMESIDSVPKEFTKIKTSKNAEKNQMKEQAPIPEIQYNKLYEKGQAGTENPIQSVDDIPLTDRKNVYPEFTTEATIGNSEKSHQNINEFFVQNTIKNVINSFVPDKTEDLMKNYGNKNAKEMVGAKVSNLRPEILAAPALRNLLNLPEIANMIIEVAGGLISPMKNALYGDVVSLVKKSFLQVVKNEFPRPKPTLSSLTVEEHRLKNGDWVTEQVSLLGSSKTDELKSQPRKIFDKIKSIIYRSNLSEKEAAQPIVQNLIIKAVKYAMDKEHEIVQESAVRKALKIIVKPIVGKSSTIISPTYDTIPSSEVRKATIPEPETATTSYVAYKLAPVIPVTENNIYNGNWKGSSKLLVDSNQKKVSTDFDEKAKEAMQEQLDKVKKIVVTSEEKSEINFESSSEYEFEDEAVQGTAREKGPSEKIKDEALDREPIKYYSPTDRILEYIKTHQNAVNPSFSTTAEIIGRANEYDTSTPITDTRDYEPRANENSAIPKQTNRNQHLNLLFESPIDFPKSQTATSDPFGDPLTASNLQTYMGRLVPVDEKASQAKDLSDLQNSKLVYVGDGARLPLTIRRLSDGTFALTLSDELCKQYLQKQCPRSLVMREPKSINDVPEKNISNDESQMITKIINARSKLERQNKNKEPTKVANPTEDLNSEKQKKISEEHVKVILSMVDQNSNSNLHSRIRRESEEQKEAIQEEKFSDSMEISLENQNKNLIINDSTKTQLNHPEGESFDLGFHVIPRMIGPYRYQQLHAKENADALRNMFFMMQGINSNEE